MLNEKMFQEMNRALKTGNVKKELAKIEVAENKIFTDAEIKRVIKECNINTITRKEIDFEKLLIQDTQYQEALNNMINFLDNVFSIDKTEENKNKVLELVNIKDNIYHCLEQKFYNISI